MKIQDYTTSSSNTQCKIKESKLSTCRGPKPNGLYIYENTLNSAGVREMENKATMKFKPISLEKIKKGKKLHFVMVAGRNDILTIANENENCYILKINLATF